MEKIFYYFKKYKWMILLVLIFTAIKSTSDLMLPTIMANIIDIGIAQNNMNYIYISGAQMLLITLIGGIFAIAGRYFSARSSISISKDLRHELFSKVTSLSFNEVDKIGTSSLITRCTNDITQIENALSTFFMLAFLAPLMFISTLIIALRKDVTLTLIIISAILILLVLAIIILRISIPIFEKNQKYIDKFNLVVRERLTGIRVIRAFDKSRFEQDKYQNSSEELKDITTLSSRIMAIFMPFVQLLFSLVSIALVYFGGIRIEAGTLGVGELMAFLQYGTQLMVSMLMLITLFVFLPRAKISLKRIMEILDMENEILDKGKFSESKLNGLVEFKDVDFYYDCKEQTCEPTLEQLNFSLKAGSYNAIIGSTGSGKSTIIKLIERFYDVSNGAILVDGRNIKDYTNKALKEVISISPQKTEILTGTVKSNVDINNKLSDEEVIEALKIADAYEFVSKFEDGIQHELNRAGTNLSGGQKQRISIARAIAKDASIYIFDDSFSALDIKTEKRVKSALFEKLKDKTIIIIAQKIESIKAADNILVIDEGKIIDSGSHEELASRCEIYKEIILSQEGAASYE